MKRSILIATAVATLIWFAGTPALAQGRGHGGVPPSTAGAAGPHGASAMHGDTGNGKSTSVSSMESSKTPGTLLAQNKNLASKLSALLTKQNITLDQALAEPSFKNLGQFVSAVHVSNNLHIPFMTLKTEILKKDGSLGKAIKTLRPDVDSKAEMKTAQKQTDEDVKESETDTDTKSVS